MGKGQFEVRELVTIADLLRDRLEEVKPDAISTMERKNLVRLAVVLNQEGQNGNPRLAVLNGAPSWVYEYMARGIIDLTPPAPPRKPARAKRRAKVTEGV